MSPARQQVRPTCAPHCAAKRPAPRRHPSVRPAWRERLPSRAGRGWISQAAQARRGQARRSMVPRAWSHETLSRLKAMSLWSMSASSVRACRLNSSHSSIPSVLVFFAGNNTREYRQWRHEFLLLSGGCRELRRAQPTEKMARSDRKHEPGLPPPTVPFERQMFPADAEVRGGRPSYASPHSGALLPKVVPRAHRP